jgi:hypothetical protein
MCAGLSHLGNVTDMADRLIVHRRSVRLDGSVWTTLSFRPSQEYVYATNRFHGTWHILSDIGGTRMLARVCWAMAYQRTERTIFVIEGKHLSVNPFDADPSSPILIVNADLGTPSHHARGALKPLLPWRKASDGRVVLQTHGLDALGPRELLQAQESTGERYIPERQRRLIDERDGFIVLAAPAPVLKEWAVWLAKLSVHSFQGMDYTELDNAGNGEVQVFSDFHQRVSRATGKRRRIFPGLDHAPLENDDLRRLVWDA